MVGDQNKGLPDGLRVNKNGIIFATGPGGVLIFTPGGEHLGTIRPGVAVANCTFNSDESILFLTAHNYVAKVEL
jgi:gluconolactonase